MQELNMCKSLFIVLTFVNIKTTSALSEALQTWIATTQRIRASVAAACKHLCELNSLNWGDEGKTRSCKAAESCQYKEVVWLLLSKCVGTLKLLVPVKSPSPCVTTTLARWTRLVVSLCSAVAIVTRAACSVSVKLCLGCRQLGNVCPHPHYCSVCVCVC